MEQGSGAPTCPDGDTPHVQETTSEVAVRERNGIRTCAPVSRHGERAARRALSLTVTLEDEAAQSSSEEGQHGGGDGGRGRQDEAQFTAKAGLEDQ